MGALLSLQPLFEARQVWRGPAAPVAARRQSSGYAGLDARLPEGGWPEGSLIELLVPAPGVGELQVLLPTLARLTAAGRDVVWVAPPWPPYAPALHRAGIALRHLHVLQASPDDARWAMESCLRSGACAAVLGWWERADDRALRRLQLAAREGQALAFLFRPAAALRQPSPAALRLEIQSDGLRIRKCRGAFADDRLLPWRGGA
jgi:cell division inhibitor SulA